MKAFNIKLLILPILLAIFVGLGFYIDNMTIEKTYKITSNYGFLEEDVNTLKQNKYVKDAIGAYSMEINDFFTVESIRDDITLSSGRLPEREHELVANNKFSKDQKKLGDTININSIPFKIVGFYDSDLNDHVYGYCLENDFDNSSYDVVNLTIKYNGNPDVILKEVKDTINANHKVVVYNDLNEKINQLESKYNMLETNIDKISNSIDSQFNDAQRKIDSGQSLISKYEKEIAEAKYKLDNGKAELDRAETTLNSSYNTLISSKNQIEAAKNELNSKLSVYGIKAEDLDYYLQEAQDRLAKYGYTVDFVEKHYDTIVNLETYINTLDNLIDRAIEILNKDLSEDDQKELENIWDQIEYYFEKLKDFLHIDKLERFLISSLEALKSDLADLNNKRIEILELVDIKASIDDIKTAVNTYHTIKNYENEYNSKYQEYESYVTKYEQGKKEYNDNLVKYNNSLKELDDYKKQLSNSKAKLSSEKNKYKKELNNYTNDLDITLDDIESLKQEKDSINIIWNYSKPLKEKHSSITIAIYSICAIASLLFVTKVLKKYEEK